MSLPKRQNDYSTLNVLSIYEAVNWIAFGVYAGDSMGPQPLFMFSQELLDEERNRQAGRYDLAFDLLLAHAEKGNLRCFGQKSSLIGPDEDRHWSDPLADHEPIPPEVFRDGLWTDEGTGGVEGDQISYSFVLISYEDLCRIFPKHPGPPLPEWLSGGSTSTEIVQERSETPADATIHSIASVEHACRTWIKERAESDQEPPSRRALYAEARIHFPYGLSQRGFNRCWEREAPTAWKRPGRKSKRS